VTLTEQLRLRYPVVQAGMGRGIATGKLAGAVSAAGGLGTVGILPLVDATGLYAGETALRVDGPLSAADAVAALQPQPHP